MLYGINPRYNVRMTTEDVRVGDRMKLTQTGWWVYDWKHKSTVRTFPMPEKEQAYGLCKLLNSIEEESDGLSK
jgi:hypothetical protein